MKLEMHKIVGETGIYFKFTHSSCGLPYNNKNSIELTANGNTKSEAVKEMLSCIKNAHDALKIAQSEIENY